MNRRNYQRELDGVIGHLEREGRVPRLLLHACCAPCSSYVLEYLSRHFAVTALYYNPNIAPPSEYERRAGQVESLVSRMPFVHPVKLVEGAYDPEAFHAAVRGMEGEPEGGRRCLACYELRIRETARRAREGGYDWFTTTLSISPLKSADRLNEIGERAAKEWQVPCLPSDFKKRDGYKRSIELSREYGLYRQNYCGCAFSAREAESRFGKNL